MTLESISQPALWSLWKRLLTMLRQYFKIPSGKLRSKLKNFFIRRRACWRPGIGLVIRLFVWLKMKLPTDVAKIYVYPNYWREMSNKEDGAPTLVVLFYIKYFFITKQARR